VDRRHGKRPLSPQAQEEASTKNEEEEEIKFQSVQETQDPLDAYFSNFSTRADHDTSAMVSALAHVIGSSFSNASEPPVSIHSGPNPNIADLTSTGYVEATPSQPSEEQGMCCNFCCMKFRFRKSLSILICSMIDLYFFFLFYGCDIHHN
jgi:hypothetical protein